MMAHQKREVQTSTAQLLLCTAEGDAAAGGAAAEEKVRSKSSGSILRREMTAGSRPANAMLAAGAARGIRDMPVGNLGKKQEARLTDPPSPSHAMVFLMPGATNHPIDLLQI